MIVDDNPANLALLERMLLRQGHEVRCFKLGKLALAAAVKKSPGLILLDINMPEMNGFEVCDRLKSTEGLSDIPVIFLSVLDAIQDKVKAFRCGAAYYISKPFLRIPMMSISHFELMPISSERSDAGLSQCETVIDISQEFSLLFLTFLSTSLRNVPHLRSLEVSPSVSS